MINIPGPISSHWTYRPRFPWLESHLSKWQEEDWSAQDFASPPHGVVAEVCWGQSFGRNVWADVECMRLMRNARGGLGKHVGLTLSCGALAESQAFLGAGKRGQSGGKCTNILRSVLRRIRALADVGVHGRLRSRVQRILRRGYKERGTEGRKRGSERARGGSGGERPVHERPEEYLDQQASEGWQAEFEGVTMEDIVGSWRKPWVWENWGRGSSEEEGERRSRYQKKQSDLGVNRVLA
jgi:hypothetical protein